MYGVRAAEVVALDNVPENRIGWKCNRAKTMGSVDNP